MDEEFWLERNLYPWLDDPSYDDAGDYDEYESDEEEELEEEYE